MGFNGQSGSQDVAEALEMDTAACGAILAKGISAFKAADAARKARELVRRKSTLTKSTLPGKLADCTSSDRAQSEIFIVEGDSAGAALPLCWQPCELRHLMHGAVQLLVSHQPGVA